VNVRGRHSKQGQKKLSFDLVLLRSTVAFMLHALLSLTNPDCEAEIRYTAINVKAQIDLNSRSRLHIGLCSAEVTKLTPRSATCLYSGCSSGKPHPRVDEALD